MSIYQKGGQIGVEGKLQTRRYVAQDGSNRIATEVICDNIHFLEPKNASQGGYNDYSSYETSYMQTPFQQQTPMSQPQNNNFYQSESKKTDQYDEVKNNLIFLMMTYHSRRKNIWQLLKGVKNLLFYRQ